MKLWLKSNRGFIVFMFTLAIFRTAIADWNPVPSGSMRPTILEGDVVLVNRLAYDLKLPLTQIAVAHLGDPQRGDIVVFASPEDGTRLIKRLVALPGDRVELRDEVLFVNGQAAVYSDIRNISEPLAPGRDIDAQRATEQLAGSRRTVQIFPRLAHHKSFGPVQVPPGMYFMLGDSRDNSRDSRFIGFVPRENINGRADRILVSADMLGHWLPRWERFASRLN